MAKDFRYGDSVECPVTDGGFYVKLLNVAEEGKVPKEKSRGRGQSVASVI